MTRRTALRGLAVGGLLCLACGYRPQITSHASIDADVAPMPDVASQCPASHVPRTTWSAYVATSDAFGSADETAPASAEAGKACVEAEALAPDIACVAAYNDRSLGAAMAFAGVGEPIWLRSRQFGGTDDLGGLDAQALKEGDTLALPAAARQEEKADRGVFAPGASQAFGTGTADWTVHLGPHQFFARAGDDIYLIQAEPLVTEERTYQVCACGCDPGTQRGEPAGGIDLFVVPRGLTFLGVRRVRYRAGRLRNQAFHDYPPCAPCG